MYETVKISDTKQAAGFLAEGKIVAFPTETVFGLGADATNAEAISKIFEAKGRPSDNPLIVHLSSIDDLSMAAREVTPEANTLLRKFAPGPLTVVLPKAKSIATSVSANLDTVGIRIPNHSSALEIIRRSQKPIAAPSANLSGRPSCTQWNSVLEDLDGRIDGVFCEDADGFGVESTVVDCTRSPVVLLRPGAISLADIREVCPTAVPFTHIQGQASTSVASESMASPGIRHPHYQPNASVHLFDSVEDFRQLLESLPSEGPKAVAVCGEQLKLEQLDEVLQASIAHHRTFANADEYAASFYEFLREADRRKCSYAMVQRIVSNATARGPEWDQVSGIEAALLDRQRRAAGVDS